MILLVVGVLMVGASRAALADDMTVTASLLGPAPTVAATIDTPAEGTRYTTKPVEVAGSCPVGTYVKILRNGVESGIAMCDAQGRYSLLIDLFVGANELQAQVYNSTDVAGPISGTRTVYYAIPVSTPVPPKSPATGNTGSGATAPQNPTGPAVQQPGAPSGQSIVIGTKFRFSGSYIGQPASFDFTISGGQGPYSILVDWGDGTQKNLNVAASGTFTVEHIYDRPGPNQGTYPIKVTAFDSQGASGFLQIIVLIKDPAPAAAGTDSPEAGGGILNYLWSIYLVILLMLISFWLGERYELNQLKPKLNRTRHV